MRKGFLTILLMLFCFFQPVFAGAIWPDSYNKQIDHTNVNVSGLRITKYDDSFKKWASIYMPLVDWRLMKAQCNSESGLNPLVSSGVGAHGICQFMSDTWDDVGKSLKIQGSPFDAALNIQFATFYMGNLRASWGAKRSDFDRHSLAMASYNAGLGNIIKAQKKCGKHPDWDQISPCLKYITGKANAQQTITYVLRNWKTYGILVTPGALEVYE